MTPETRYANSGGVSIAYQVLGEGALDLVVVPGWVSNLEVAWEDPDREGFCRRLARFSRLILFDKRGTGLSDRVSDLPSLEVRMDDVRAVLDAVDSQRAALFGWSEGGPMSALFAATYPQRTSALIMHGSYPRWLVAPGYECGRTQEQLDAFLTEIERDWGQPVGIDARAPSRAHDECVPPAMGALPAHEREPDRGGDAYANERAGRHPRRATEHPRTDLDPAQRERPGAAGAGEPLHGRLHRWCEVHRVARHRPPAVPHRLRSHHRCN